VAARDGFDFGVHVDEDELVRLSRAAGEGAGPEAHDRHADGGFFGLKILQGAAHGGAFRVIKGRALEAFCRLNQLGTMRGRDAGKHDAAINRFDHEVTV